MAASTPRSGTTPPPSATVPPRHGARARPAWETESFGFRHSPDATFVLSERRILQASDMAEEVFGWTPAELRGQSIRLLYPGQTDFDVIGRRALQAMLQSPFYRDERFMRRKDGQLIWMEARGRTLDTSNPYELAVWVYRPIEAPVPQESPLTPTEKTIARYLANGFTSKETALALGRSPRTIEVHRANMMRKLQVRNGSELIRRLMSL